MPRKNEILQELTEISPFLCKIENSHLFAVPSQYFEQLPSKIWATIQKEEMLAEDEPFRFSAIPAIIQDIPNNYFNTLSEKIFSNIQKDNVGEELSDFPLLVSLKGKNVFTVPQGYFENVAEGILTNITTGKEGKVVSINRGKVVSMHSTWWKAAAAAVIAGIIGVSSYFVVNNAGSQDQSTYVNSGNQYNTTEQVKVAIASLSDDEIADYLENHGNILDNDLLLKDINTQELPTTEDYLLDDNALNNYLNKIGALEAEKLN
jgi:hypothetical protein